MADILEVIESVFARLAQAEVDALVAKISDKKVGQSAPQGLAKIAEEQSKSAEPCLVAEVWQDLQATGYKSKAVLMQRSRPPRR